MKQKDILAFIGLSIAWGSSFFWVKVALEELGPFTLVALRLLLGGVSLGVIAYATKTKLPKSWREWWPFLLIGLTNVAFPLVLTSWGQIFIDSGVAAILLSTVPIFTVVIAHFILSDDRLTLVRALGIFVGFAGVVVLLLRDVDLNAGSSAIGYATQLIGSLFYAASAVLARYTLKNTSVILQAFIPLALADLILWGLVPLVESPIHLPHIPIVVVSILFLGFICSCVGYLLYYYLIHSIGPTRTSMITYVFPLVGVGLGVLFLNELIDLQLVVGALLVLGSVFVVNRA
jgi:drug/metabolite transporter (DMT)-like permease